MYLAGVKVGSERGRVAPSAIVIPDVSPLLSASRQPPPALVPAGPDQRQGLGQGVVPLYASDGGGLDGSRLVAERGAALSRAPVAPAADGLENDAGR